MSKIVFEFQGSSAVRSIAVHFNQLDQFIFNRVFLKTIYFKYA